MQTSNIRLRSPSEVHLVIASFEQRLTGTCEFHRIGMFCVQQLQESDPTVPPFHTSFRKCLSSKSMRSRRRSPKQALPAHAGVLRRRAPWRRDSGGHICASISVPRNIASFVTSFKVKQTNMMICFALTTWPGSEASCCEDQHLNRRSEVSNSGETEAQLLDVICFQVASYSLGGAPGQGPSETSHSGAMVIPCSSCHLPSPICTRPLPRK